MRIEPRLGGRVLEVYRGGDVLVIARITAWNPESASPTTASWMRARPTSPSSPHHRGLACAFINTCGRVGRRPFCSGLRSSNGWRRGAPPEPARYHFEKGTNRDGSQRLAPRRPGGRPARLAFRGRAPHADGAGYDVIVFGGPEPDDVFRNELRGGDVVVTWIGVPPEEGDLVYTFRPIEELPGIVTGAVHMGASAIWRQSGTNEAGERDPRGLASSAGESDRARRLVEQAGLVYIDDVYITDAVRALHPRA